MYEEDWDHQGSGNSNNVVWNYSREEERGSIFKLFRICAQKDCIISWEQSKNTIVKRWILRLTAWVDLTQRKNVELSWYTSITSKSHNKFANEKVWMYLGSNN